MATAAVVIVAATLTLTIQRDPEIDRLYEKYDKPSPVMRERSETSSADKPEIVADLTRLWLAWAERCNVSPDGRPRAEKR